MINKTQETIADIVAEKEAEIARLNAALAASNDELALARSNSRAMYHRLNSENIRISEMDRETIHGLREEDAKLRALVKELADALDSYPCHNCKHGSERCEWCGTVKELDALVERAREVVK